MKFCVHSPSVVKRIYWVVKLVVIEVLHSFYIFIYYAVTVHMLVTCVSGKGEYDMKCTLCMLVTCTSGKDNGGDAFTASRLSSKYYDIKRPIPQLENKEALQCCIIT